MPEPTYRILAIAGSLRDGSYNRSLIRNAATLAPPELEFDLFDLREIPLYDADVESAGDPEPVAELKRRVAEADAVFIATPEYNGFFSGVLHNALDWASRPGGSSVFKDKPVAMTSVSTGQRGGRRAQPHLRTLLGSLRAIPIDIPDLHVGNAAERFDAQGVLTNEETRDELRQFLAGLVGWMHGFNAQAEAA